MCVLARLISAIANSHVGCVYLQGSSLRIPWVCVPTCEVDLRERVACVCAGGGEQADGLVREVPAVGQVQPL